MLIYATPEDLETWTGTAAPDNAPLLLRSASILIRSATRVAFYDIDTLGFPTSTPVLAAMRDAACAQAAAWNTLGLDPTAGPAGVGGVVASSGIGGANVTYAVPPAQAADRAASLTTLVPEAAQILIDAGLLAGGPIVFG